MLCCNRTSKTKLTKESKMALKDARNKTAEVKEEVKTANVGNTENTMNINTGATMGLGLDLLGGLFMSVEDGSEYTNKYAEAAREKVAREATVAGMKIENKIIKLDNSQFVDLPYSYVVFATKADTTDKVYYHVVCLEATGRKPVTVNQIVADLQNRNSSLIYTPADTFDPVLKQRVDQVLQAAFGIDPVNFVTTEGHIVPHDQDPAEIAKVSAVIAYNANIAKLAMDKGLIGPINIQKLVQAEAQSFFQLDITYSGGVTIGALGRPVRSDFELDTQLVTTTKQNGIMPREARKRINTAVGYVEYIPEERQIGFGQAPQKDIIPMIILDQFHGIRPTLELSILSILNAVTFSNPQNLFALLMRVPRDLGALNVIANLDGDKSGFGKNLKFKSGKLSDEQIIQILQRMVRPNPVIAVEVEYYGADFAVNAPFAALAVPGIRERATEEIVQTAEALTGHKFQNRTVMHSEAIIVPVGEWLDKSGTKRDVREIDLAYVIEHTNDINIIMKWVASNLPASVTGMDPYIAKLEVIAAIIPNATITGKAARIVLNPAFVAELATAAVNAGYNPRTDIGAVQYTQFNNLQAVASVFGGATLNNVQFGNYGQQQMFTAPNVNMFGWR
jgi:hypothetical protein